MDFVIAQIIQNYKSFDEDSRLKTAYGIIEEEHTRRLISRQIDKTSLNIFDIGGGTGHYSAWLAKQGHAIYFSDIVPRHLEIFNQHYGNAANIISSGIEDARSLSYTDDSADMVLLNGPLYHLTNRADRIKVLQETKRILKKGGKLLGFSISRFAGLDYALSTGEIFNEDYFGMVKNELLTGIRDNRDRKNKTFLEAYFHLVDEIEAEYLESGLTVEKSYGVSGPAWNTPGLEEAIKDTAKKERLLLVAQMMEQYPQHSTKIMTVGIKG